MPPPSEIKQWVSAQDGLDNLKETTAPLPVHDPTSPRQSQRNLHKLPRIPK